MSWRDWRERREFTKLLNRSCLAHDRLYGICKDCSAHRAKDPYTGNCVECGGTDWKPCPPSHSL